MYQKENLETMVLNEQLLEQLETEGLQILPNAETIYDVGVKHVCGRTTYTVESQNPDVYAVSPLSENDETYYTQNGLALGQAGQTALVHFTPYQAITHPPTRVYKVPVTIVAAMPH